MALSSSLTGVRVVAVEQAVAGPLCSRHLADLGADVVKVERPDGGDFARHYDSVVHGESAYFVWLNRGKRSVTADLRTPLGRQRLDKLLETADVFVSNLGPGALDRLGYSSAEVGQRWPRLITCAISGYGDGGPFRDAKAFDLLLQGESGLLSVTGTASEPAKVGISLADISAGVYAALAIVAAIRDLDKSGSGQHLSISMLDCIAEWMSVPLLYQIYAGSAPDRLGSHHATIAPYGPYETSDGQSVLIAVQNDAQWHRFCEHVLLDGDYADDSLVSSNELRVKNRAELEGRIRSRLSLISRDELLARLDKADVPSARMNKLSEVVAHPQLVDRGRWRIGESPSGPVEYLVAPFLSEPTQARIPALGQHTSELFSAGSGGDDE